MIEGNKPITQFKRILIFILVLAVLGEMILYPSIANLYGCIMAIIAYVVFSYFFNEKYIRLFPFSFCMFLSMFMYRFLPLVATLMEGKPVSYGFERPFETFILEILLYLTSALAFFLACQKSKFSNRNNIIKKGLARISFYQITPSILWGMGFVGLLANVYNIVRGDAGIGDAVGKFFGGINYLVFAPICLFFPSFLRIQYKNKKLLLIYTIFVIVMNLASNKRHLIITPMATIAILFMLYLILNNIKLTQVVSPKKLLIGGLLLFLGLSALNNVSLAMLHTRKTMLYTEELRDSADKIETFEFTLQTLQDEQLMEDLKSSNKLDGANELSTYAEGWTEDYVDNFLLSRYANMRITDETLYYAQKKGYANPMMQENFVNSILYLFPTPMLRFFGFNLDKTQLDFSRGDFLYGSGFGSYKVTSHIGDGLATFGYWYFLLQFFVTFIMFKLLNTFVYYVGSGVVYAPVAIMDIFGFLGKFRNAQGIFGDMSYMVRGYVEGIITYVIVYYLVKGVLSLFFSKMYKKEVFSMGRHNGNQWVGSH